MTITITLAHEDERRLAERAAAAGKDLPTYLDGLIKKDLSAPTTFAELLAPLHEDFRQSGMTEDELNDLIEESRDDVWRQQQSRAHP